MANAEPCRSSASANAPLLDAKEIRAMTIALKRYIEGSVSNNNRIDLARHERDTDRERERPEHTLCVRQITHPICVRL